MEAIDREDIDPKTINFTTISDTACKKLTKDEILAHMQTVITGCCNSMQVPNTLSSWKITARGLGTIKHIEKDFFLGVRMWLDITQNNLMGCDNDEILEQMSNELSWIKDLLLIKNYINTNHAT